MLVPDPYALAFLPIPTLCAQPSQDAILFSGIIPPTGAPGRADISGVAFGDSGNGVTVTAWARFDLDPGSSANVNGYPQHLLNWKGTGTATFYLGLAYVLPGVYRIVTSWGNAAGVSVYYECTPPSASSSFVQFAMQGAGGKQWNHYALTVTAADGAGAAVATIYVNGQAATCAATPSSSSTLPFPAFTTWSQAAIGVTATALSSVDPFLGMIADVMLISSVVNATDMALLGSAVTDAVSGIPLKVALTTCSRGRDMRNKSRACANRPY